MWDIFSVVLAGLVTFMSIVGVIIPQWVTRRYQATDFGGRFRVGLLEYPSEYSGKYKFAAVYYEITVVLELLALFFSIIVFFLLFLKVFMGKDDKRIHLGAAGLSTLAGLLMMIGPFVFCHNKYVFNQNGKEEMGNAMFICMAAGGLAIVHGLLLGAFYLNKKIFGVPVLDLDENAKEPCIEQKV